MTSARVGIGLLLILAVLGGWVFGLPQQRSDPGFAAVHGDEIDPRRCAEGRLGVLIFVTTDCPIANGYAPQIQELIAAFADRPVDFHLVHVDPKLTRAAAAEHAEAYGYRGSILLDSRHDLVRWSGATITPEAVLFDSAGKIHYRGRINNWYGDIGRKRYQVSRHDLRDAIEARLAGRPVAAAESAAVGCVIEPVE